MISSQDSHETNQSTTATPKGGVWRQLFSRPEVQMSSAFAAVAVLGLVFLGKSEPNLAGILGLLLCLSGGFLLQAQIKLIQQVERLSLEVAGGQKKQQETAAEVVRATHENLDLLARHNLLLRLIHLTRPLSEMGAIDATMRKILEATMATTGAESGSIILIDETGRVTAAIFPDLALNEEERALVAAKVLEQGVAGWVVNHQEPVLIGEADSDERWISLAEGQANIHSVISLPIVSYKTTIGVLTLTHPSRNHFDRNDLELLIHGTHHIAMALANAAAFERQQALVARQGALYQLLKIISSQIDPDEIARVVVETVIELTGWSHCGLFVPDFNAGTLELIYANGSAGQDLPRPFQVDLGGDSPAAVCLAGGRLLQIQPAVDGVSAVLPGKSAAREMLIPINHGREPLGVLYFGDGAPAPFHAEEIAVARSIAEAATLTLANANLIGKLSSQSGLQEALIEANQDGLLLIGLDRKVLVINQKAIDLLQLPPITQGWQGEKIDHIQQILAKTAPQLVQSLNRELDVLATVTIRSSQVEFQIGDRLIKVFYLPVRAESRPVGRVIVLKDVTEARLTERMKEELTHTMVHDLRNPLHIISSGHAVLREMFENGMAWDAQQEQLARIIDANTGKMLRLVNSILDIGRLESNRLPLELEEIDLAREVDEAILAVEPLMMEKKVTAVVNIPPEATLAWADREIFGRVLQNLIDNGLKFTRPGSELSIYTQPRHEDEKVILYVRDSGPGIPPELKNRLFDRFVTGGMGGSGSGLGLAFCKMAIEAHQERIWVVESSEAGTIFAVSLPTRLKQADLEAAVRESRPDRR